MPNRIIKDSIHTSDTCNEMTDFQFRLWVNLITYVDDFGRGDARAAIIKGTCFPLRERLTNKDIESALAGLAGLGCISLYEVDGKSYLCFPTWEKHQSIRNKKSRFPAPPDNLQKVESNCNQLQANVPVIQSNPNTNPNQNTNSAPARADTPAQRQKYGQYGWVRLTQEEYSRLLEELGEAELRRCIEYVDESAQGNGNKNRWKDWNLVIRKCHRDGWGLNRQGKPKQVYSSYTGHEGPTEEEYQRMQKMLKDFGGEDGETEDLPFA